jgi:hypothetical protein
MQETILKNGRQYRSHPVYIKKQKTKQKTPKNRWAGSLLKNPGFFQSCLGQLNQWRHAHLRQVRRVAHARQLQQLRGPNGT